MLDKSFAQPATFALQVHPCGEDRHRLYVHVITNMEQKIYWIKILFIRTGGENDVNFFQARISGYAVYYYVSYCNGLKNELCVHEYIVAYVPCCCMAYSSPV